MSLRSNWVIYSTAVLLTGAMIGCAPEPPRRPLEYGTGGNQPAHAMTPREPLYTPPMSGSLTAGTPTTFPSLTGHPSTAPVAPGITTGQGATTGGAAPELPAGIDTGTGAGAGAGTGATGTGTGTTDTGTGAGPAAPAAPAPAPPPSAPAGGGSNP